MFPTSADIRRIVTNHLDVELFLDTDDVTITVDPVSLNTWIHDGDIKKFRDDRVKQFHKDRISYLESVGWEKPMQGEVKFFVPTSEMLDKADKWWIPTEEENRFGRGDIRDKSRFGKLPTISQLLYDNQLVNKASYEIEHEMKEADRRAGERIYNRDGYTR